MTKSDIQSILGAKTVSYNSLFAKAIRNVPAAVFLSQAIFWQEKAKFKNALDTIEIDGEVYFAKTGAEWFDETGLTSEQQKTARKCLCALAILKEKRAGVPAKMYFRIDIDALVSGISAYLNTRISVSGISANRITENPRTSSGKFRKQEAGISANSNNIESFESFESEGENETTPPPAENFSLEAEKEKAPPVAPAPPFLPLEEPFTSIGQYAPAETKILRLHTPDLPGVELVEAAPKPMHHTTDPRSTPPEKFGRVDIAAEIDELKNDPAAKEAFALSRKIPQRFFEEYADAFRLDILGRGETYNNRKDFRRHFFSWSGVRYEIAQKAQTKNGATRAHLTPGGANPAVYLEKQKF